MYTYDVYIGGTSPTTTEDGLKMYLDKIGVTPSSIMSVDPLQSAYRSGHSTETAIVKLSTDIVSNLDRGHCVILASLDLSAAFDTVDHGIFLQQLKHT